MNMMAVGLAAAGFAAVMVAWGTYLATIPSGKVPARPVGAIGLQLVGVGLAIAAIVWGYRDGGSPGVAAIVLAAFAVMMAAVFFYVFSLRRTPIGDLKVQVGDTLLAFEAVTSEGAQFRSDSLAGKRALLKFFRGGW